MTATGPPTANGTPPAAGEPNTTSVLMYAWTGQLAGAGQLPGSRDGLIHAVITSVAGPYITKGAL